MLEAFISILINLVSLILVHTSYLMVFVLVYCLSQVKFTFTYLVLIWWFNRSVTRSATISWICLYVTQMLINGGMNAFTRAYEFWFLLSFSSFLIYLWIGRGSFSNAREFRASCHDGEGFRASPPPYGDQSWVSIITLLFLHVKFFHYFQVDKVLSLCMIFLQPPCWEIF